MFDVSVWINIFDAANLFPFSVVYYSQTLSLYILHYSCKWCIVLIGTKIFGHRHISRTTYTRTCSEWKQHPEKTQQQWERKRKEKKSTFTFYYIKYILINVHSLLCMNIMLIFRISNIKLHHKFLFCFFPLVFALIKMNTKNT